MDELKEQLMQILNDPGSMQQIASLAGALSAGESDVSDHQPSIPLPSPEVLLQVQSLLQQAGQTDERREALVQALSPYLKPNRRKRLQRAMQIAHLSQLAGAALQKMNHGTDQGGVGIV